MRSGPLNMVVQQLRAAERGGCERTDGELLTCFLSKRDKDALAALVERHAPMVWGVCRRILRSHHDAEDAFQATFIVLVHKATSVVQRELVGNWLYGVAHQTALRLRATAAKRGVREMQMKQMPEPEVAEAREDELLSLLDQELSRMPEQFRALIVLCDLEGKTRKEVARQLGCPEGTVASRYARAKAILAKRLARHGLVVSGWSLAVALSHSVASADVPPSVVTATINVATLLAAGNSAGVISGPVTTLTQGILKTMFIKKILTAAVVVLALGAAVITGGSLAVGQTEGAGKPTVGPEDAGKEPIFKPTAKAPVPNAKPKEDKERLQGTWHIVEANAGGKHQAIEISKEQVWVFTGDTLVINYDDKSRLEMSYQIDPKQKPKAIDLSPADEREKGYVFKGIYELDGDRLKLNYSRNVAPDAKRPERFDPEVEDRGMRSFVLKRAPEKEAFTAWGKVVGGLQAGLTIGNADDIRIGGKVKSVVRLRNVSKETTKVSSWIGYLGVVDAQGTRVRTTTAPAVDFEIIPDSFTLKPGETVEVGKTDLSVAELDQQVKVPDGVAFMCVIHVAPGKYKAVCSDFLLKEYSGLATGAVEFEVKPAKDEDFTAWGKEVNGVQIGIHFGEHRAYRVGETVTLTLRLRNNGKEKVPYRDTAEYFYKNPPLITDADGKVVTIKERSIFGFMRLRSIAPGKEVDLIQLELALRPVTDREKDDAWTLYGTGKFQFLYPVKDVVGEVQLGSPGMTLTTGKLELEVKKADDKKPTIENPDKKPIVDTIPPWTSIIPNPDEEPIKVVTIEKSQNKLLFFRDGHLVLIDPDGKNEKKVTLEPLTYYRDARLSPDGKKVAHIVSPGVRKGQKIPVDLQTKLFIRGIDDTGAGVDLDAQCKMFVWSPDGSEIACTEFSGQPDDPFVKKTHFVVDVKTKEKKPLKIPDGHYLNDWSRDGKFFLTAHITDTHPRRLDAPGWVGLARLYLMKRDGTEPKALTEEGRFCTEGRLSPDGLRLLHRHITRPNEGKEEMKQVLAVLDNTTGKSAMVGDLPPNCEILGFCWSPDGKRIAYTWKERHEGKPEELEKKETKSSLVVCDPDGKNAKTIATEKGGSPWEVTIGRVDWR